MDTEATNSPQADRSTRKGRKRVLVSQGDVEGLTKAGYNRHEITRILVRGQPPQRRGVIYLPRGLNPRDLPLPAAGRGAKRARLHWAKVLENSAKWYVHLLLGVGCGQRAVAKALGLSQATVCRVAKIPRAKLVLDLYLEHVTGNMKNARRRARGLPARPAPSKRYKRAMRSGPDYRLAYPGSPQHCKRVRLAHPPADPAAPYLEYARALALRRP